MKLTLHLVYIAVHNAYISYLDLTSQTRADYKYSMFLDDISHVALETEEVQYVDMHIPWQYGQKRQARATWQRPRTQRKRTANVGTASSATSARLRCARSAMYIYMYTPTRPATRVGVITILDKICPATRGECHPGP